MQYIVLKYCNYFVKYFISDRKTRRYRMNYFLVLLKLLLKGLVLGIENPTALWAPPLGGEGIPLSK
jgi:hypothetical protein